MNGHSDTHPIAASQLTPGDARPVEPGVSRRGFLRNASVAALAGVIPAAAAAATVSALPALIAAHKDAEAAYLTAVEAKEDVEDAMRYDFPHVPLMWTPDGKARVGRLELKPGGEDYVRRQIVDQHETLRRSLCSPVAMALSPEHCADAARGIDTSLAACLEAVEAGIDDLHRQEEAAGLTAAEQRVDDAYVHVDRLSIAILGHVPTSPADAQLKADWIASEYGRRGSYFSDEEMAALVASIAGKAVA